MHRQHLRTLRNVHRARVQVRVDRAGQRGIGWRGRPRRRRGACGAGAAARRAPEPWRQRSPRVARDFSYRNAIDARVIYWPAGARVFITSRNQTFKERRWNLSRAAAARPPGGGEDSGNGRERRASVCRRNNGQGRYPRVCPNPYYANEMGVL